METLDVLGRLRVDSGVASPHENLFSMKGNARKFQAALAETQAAGMEVIFDPVDGEEGLQKIQSLVVSDRAPEGEEEDGMEMDEFQAALMEHGLDTQAIDALPAVSEEELEEMMAGYEEDDQLQEAWDQTNGAEEKNKEATE